MLKEKMEKALNAQVNAELWAAYLYQSMAMDAEFKALKGVANWFSVQAKEEVDHAKILMNYINSRGGKVVLTPIEAVDTEWKSALAMFEAALDHEKKVTAMIDNLCEIADSEKDRATAAMLLWFVDEQVEEEESAQAIIDELQMVEGNKAGLYMVDKDLGARTYTQATALTEE